MEIIFDVWLSVHMHAVVPEHWALRDALLPLEGRHLWASAQRLRSCRGQCTQTRLAQQCPARVLLAGAVGGRSGREEGIAGV